eukprot:gene11694-34420_t
MILSVISMRQIQILLLGSLTLGALFFNGRVAADDGGWRTGRTTWYDDAAWMSVHHGSCMYGHVGAVNEGADVYGGSCGKCFEMKCSPAVVTDAFGMVIDRSGDCLTEEPIQIAITDTCPCYKEENLFSNKRWCCGDMDHFDIGIWAFNKMADSGKGVIGIQYRAIECPGWLTRPLASNQDASSIINGQFNPDAGKTSSGGGDSSGRYQGQSPPQSQSGSPEDGLGNWNWEGGSGPSSPEMSDSYGNEQYGSPDNNDQQDNWQPSPSWDDNSGQSDSYGNEQYGSPDNNDQQDNWQPSPDWDNSGQSDSYDNGGDSYDNGGDSYDNGGDSYDNGGDSYDNGGDSYDNGGLIDQQDNWQPSPDWDNSGQSDSYDNGGDSYDNGGDSYDNGGDSYDNGGDSYDNGGDSYDNGGDSYNNYNR